MKNKKGELTSKQLITIIILIISFTIIIAFFVMLGLRAIINNESCRNSVMMRSSLPIFKDLISLKCKTEDICFSMGGKCSAEADRTLEIKDTEDLKKEMANLLADCWWKMGEGKVNYGGNGDCAICYIVSFDEEAKKIDPNWVDISSYISTTKMPAKDLTYGVYLYSGSETKLIKGETVIFTDTEYAIATGIYDGKYIPPYFIKFSASELKSKLGCSNFVTEV